MTHTMGEVLAKYVPLAINIVGKENWNPDDSVGENLGRYVDENQFIDAYFEEMASAADYARFASDYGYTKERFVIFLDEDIMDTLGPYFQKRDDDWFQSELKRLGIK